MFSTQLISAQSLALSGKTFSGLRKLTLELDAEEHIININNSYTPPISWFLTNEYGALVRMGQIEDFNFRLDLSCLSSGLYTLRIAGEVHTLKINH